MKIAIIPARGGSKRIPQKNIKAFFGKPIIAWSIEAALRSNLFDSVIVSTDSEEIAGVARSYGAYVPFIRPSELSGDYIGLIDVIYHATKWINDHKLSVDEVCCILATAPLIDINDINRGYDLLIKEKYSFVMSVTDYAHPIFRSFQMQLRGVKMFFPENFHTRSQDLPEAFHDAAQFYWGTSAAWLSKKCEFGDETGTIKIPRWRAQDIDTEDDWAMAEFLARYAATDNYKINKT
jgi:N-acylneuraminate cytidylyltransferase